MKSFVKAIAFIAIFAVLFACFAGVFSEKTGTMSIDSFYKQEEDTVDVLMLGSSHSYTNIRTDVFWNEYGYASYNLGAPAQTLWDTYYYFKEALKTQKPRVIMLECYKVLVEEEYNQKTREIDSIFGMRWSQNRIDAINTGVKAEDKVDMYLEYGTYHNRYASLGRDDFSQFWTFANPQYYKGNAISYKTGYAAPQDISNVTKSAQLPSKSERYLKKIIKLAKKNDIPIILYVAPYDVATVRGAGEVIRNSSPINAQLYFNRVQQIADEYDVPFYNFNLMYSTIGLDGSTDFGDQGDHLNYVGAGKLTHYIGKYILNGNYDIPDRRGDAAYDSWQKQSEDTARRIENNYYAKKRNLKEYIEKMLNNEEGYTVVVTLSGDVLGEQNYLNSEYYPQEPSEGAYTTEYVRRLLENYGIDMTKLGKGGTVVKQDGEIIYCSEGEREYQWQMQLDWNYVVAAKGIRTQDAYGSETQTFDVLVNNSSLKKVENGVSFLVYDSLTEQLVSVVGFDSATRFGIVR